MRNRFTKSPIIGRFRTSNTTLPIYMLATKPQNSVGRPLSKAAQAVLATQPRIDEGPFVFTTTGLAFLLD